MIDYKTVKQLAFTFSPILISYGISYFRSIKSQVRANKPSVRPVPPHIRNVLNVLLLAAAIALTLSLPYFTPENILTDTSSRVSTSTELLFKRVREILRPDGQLTAMDEKLNERLVSIESRCLYLLFGPDALANCPFCDSDDPKSYLVYALPTILAPYLLNIGVLGLATSGPFGGREGNRWRMHVVLAAYVQAALDISMFWNINWKTNGRIFYAEELVYYHAWIRLGRYVAITVLDIAFAGLLWATSTNRLFVVPYSTAERVDAVGRAMEMTTSKLNAAGIVRNAAARDQDMRDKSNAYWQKEGEVMAEVMTSEGVSKAVSQALSTGRLNMERIEMEARNYSEKLIHVQEIPNTAATAS
ncbi:MAG: hypothetical protein MMC23_007317 [Stictis urceolatum]|nr:hypothetical protein [Stictis urceolata]